ncbi:MAG: hypothetical protein U9R28_05145 [Pseudomonadota bacterium]|nr:hypothetical protein [Pseudomonadota bacterium]
MTIKSEYENTLEKLKEEREQINARLHRASDGVKKEFAAAEYQWEILKLKVADIADDTQETSEELLEKAKLESERLKLTYRHLNQRISKGATSTKEEFETLFENLKVERDEIKLQLHLASMEVKQEFEPAEKQWQTLKVEAAEIADTTKETSVELLGNAKIVAEELKEAYQRIKQRLSK